MFKYLFMEHFTKKELPFTKHVDKSGIVNLLYIDVFQFGAADWNFVYVKS